MLTCTELYNCSENPRINMISLELLREYYETYLMPYKFEYTATDYSDKTSNKINIDLRFDAENFCHLLGIESIVSKNVRKKDLYKYKGKCGFDNIKSGIIDFKFLKSINKKGFNDNNVNYHFISA
ncbi:hypothetical protein [Aeribacillus pallidus]|uniref:hypothetical protein n=3 Tax=Aeribacillus TaxID=1055323 RepID=UPI00082441E3|nr:hypothetical protein [Aeribacillus pallidus]